MSTDPIQAAAQKIKADLTAAVAQASADIDALVALIPTPTPTPTPTVKPTLVTPPKVTGSLVVGSKLTSTRAVFAGGQPSSDSIAWASTTQQGVPGSIIPGTTGQTTYTPVAGDVGRYVYSVETASNAAGVAVGYGWTTAPITAAPSPTPTPTPAPTPSPSPVVEPGNPLNTGPSGIGGQPWTDTMAVPVPGAVIPTANFGGWSWWGQGQGGPPYSATTNPANDFYGEALGTDTPANLGIPAPPNRQQYVGYLTVTSTSLSDMSLASAKQGITSAKLYKYFQANGKTPTDVSGTYRAWLYLPSSFAVPVDAGNTGNNEVNLFQFKEMYDNPSQVSDPLWWVQLCSASWAKTYSTAKWITAAPSNPTAPVAFLNRWGNNWKRPVAFYAIPLDEWFEITCTLTQGQQAVYAINGTTFDTAQESEYHVGPFHASSVAWIFGVGNYANIPNTLYVGEAGFTPA